jgi:hypothetical protein
MTPKNREVDRPDNVTAEGARDCSPQRDTRADAGRSLAVWARTRCKCWSAHRRVDSFKRKDYVPTWLWIVIIIVVVLAAFGYFRRGRTR